MLSPAQLVPAKVPHPSLQSCSQPLRHKPESLHGLVPCHMQDLESVHLKFPKVPLLTHFHSLSRSLWMVALPSRVSTGHPNLVSPTNLNTVSSIISSRLLIKKFSRTGPSIFHLLLAFWFRISFNQPQSVIINPPFYTLRSCPINVLM